MKRRILALLLVGCCLFLFAGCSATELGLYNSVRSISQLKDYTFSGQTQLQNTSPDELEIPNGNISVSYSGLVSASRDVIVLNSSVKDNETGKTVEVDATVNGDTITLSSDAFKALDSAATVKGSTVTVKLSDLIDEFCTYLVDNGANPDKVAEWRTTMKNYSTAGAIINELNSIEDRTGQEVVTKLFKNLSLGDVVKSDKAGRYTVHLGSGNDDTSALEALTALAAYLSSNETLVKSVVNDYFNNTLQDKDYRFLGIGQSDEQNLKQAVSSLQSGDIDEICAGAEMAAGILSEFLNASYDLTFEKDAGNSYSIDSSFTYSTKEGADIPSLKGAVTSKLKISEISADAAVSGVTTSGADFAVTITPDKALPVRGLIYSTDPNNKTGVTKVPAVAGSNGAYTVALRGLKANTSYYYQAYAQNSLGVLVLGPVHSFKTAAVSTGSKSTTPVAATIQNPKTGDNGGTPYVAILAGSGLLLASLELARKKKLLKR